MSVELITGRLLLRPWREEDAEELFRYASDPVVGEAAGWPPHRSVEESLQVIRTVFSAPEIYAMVLKETGLPVGCCGIVRFGDIFVADPGSGEVEIGYWIGVPYWGQGLVPEAVRVLVERCFNDLSVKRIWIAHYEGNDRSRRVAEKCGFVHHHTATVRGVLSGDARSECFLSLSSPCLMQRAGHGMPSEPPGCTS